MKEHIVGNIFLKFYQNCNFSNILTQLEHSTLRGIFLVIVYRHPGGGGIMALRYRGLMLGKMGISNLVVYHVYVVCMLPFPQSNWNRSRNWLISKFKTKLKTLWIVIRPRQMCSDLHVIQ